MQIQKAIDCIHRSITKFGIVASSEASENYDKIWSRDAIITGLMVGIVYQDIKVTAALVDSVEYLALHQSSKGQIPSNVSIIPEAPAISYGKLVGRIDATTWWVIGACVLVRNHLIDREKYHPKISAALELLQSWEYNGRGLLYTPIGGNWADEYYTEGYTLYDNALYLWALNLAAETYGDGDWNRRAILLKSLLETNFALSHPKTENIYHEKALQELSQNKIDYLPSSLGPAGYDLRWDMAAHAIAGTVGIRAENVSLQRHLHALHEQFGHWMLPVFAPVIKESDCEWKKLNLNYSYRFKNMPYHFQNGGSWPIFLGWLCWHLDATSDSDISYRIKNEYEGILSSEAYQFSEYISTDELKTCGKKMLCFSAVGYLMLCADENTKQNINKILW